MADHDSNRVGMTLWLEGKMAAERQAIAARRVKHVDRHLAHYDETGTLNPNSHDPYSRDQKAILGKPSGGTDVRLQGGGGQAQSGPRSRWW